MPVLNRDPVAVRFPANALPTGGQPLVAIRPPRVQPRYTATARGLSRRQDGVRSQISAL